MTSTREVFKACTLSLKFRHFFCWVGARNPRLARAILFSVSRCCCLRNRTAVQKFGGISLNSTIPRVIPAFTKVCGAQSLGAVIHIPKLWGESHYPGPMKILVNFHQIRELSSSFYHFPFLQKFRNCVTDLIFG